MANEADAASSEGKKAVTYLEGLKEHKATFLEGFLKDFPDTIDKDTLGGKLKTSFFKACEIRMKVGGIERQKPVKA